jgi:hypothetical protein
MAPRKDRFQIIIKKGNKRMAAKVRLADIHKLIFVINHQFTNAPNTTQIASGAGRSSAAGNNAAIQSPNTRQQQSVGSGGTARNTDSIGSSPLRFARSGTSRRHYGKEVVVVINDQIVKLPKTPQPPRWPAAAASTAREERTPPSAAPAQSNNMPWAEAEQRRTNG